MRALAVAALAALTLSHASARAQSCESSSSTPRPAQARPSDPAPPASPASPAPEPSAPTFDSDSSPSLGSASSGTSRIRARRAARREARLACDLQGGIVGDSTCTRFGEWDAGERRPWTFGLNISTLRLGLDDVAIAGRAMHDNRPHVWNADNLEDGPGVSVAARAQLFVLSHLYLGVEASFGGISMDGDTEGDAATVDLDRALVVGGGLLVGTSVGLGRFRFDLEAMGGRRRVMIRGTSVAEDCIITLHESFGQWTLRGGAGVSYFLRPTISVGVQARYGFLQNEVNAALSITMHSRAYNAR
ncbi:MAG: hypothetical protein AB8H86_32375 [Polyangiales bacterium]